MVLSLDDIERRIFLMDSKYDANFGDWIRNEDNARIVGYHLRKYIDDYSSEDFIVALKWIVKDWTLRNIIVLVQKMIIDDFERIGCKEFSELIEQCETNNDSTESLKPEKWNSVHGKKHIAERNDENIDRNTPQNSNNSGLSHIYDGEGEIICRTANISAESVRLQNENSDSNTLNIYLDAPNQYTKCLTAIQIKTRIELIKGLIYTWTPIFISEFINCIIQGFANKMKIAFMRVAIQDFNSAKMKQIVDRVASTGIIENIDEINFSPKSKKKRDNLFEAYNVI